MTYGFVLRGGPLGGMVVTETVEDLNDIQDTIWMLPTGWYSRLVEAGVPQVTADGRLVYVWCAA